MKAPHIDLHIDALVLDGFAHLDRAQLGAAVEAELARLFAEQGFTQAAGQTRYIPRLDGGSFETTPGAGADAVGRRIAQAVYGGLPR